MVIKHYKVKQLIHCVIFLSAFLLISFGFGQDSFPGCADLTANDFSYKTMLQKTPTDNSIAADASLNEPIGLDFDPVMDGINVTGVDIYYAERKGKVKRYNAFTNQVTEVGTIDVRVDRDQGINGIALDPNFKTNRFIYLYYTRNTTEPRKRFRLSRFTLNNDKTLDNASEKVLFEMQGGWRDDWHHGGPMTFDRHGNLWLTMGNDSPDHNNGGTGTHVNNDSVFSDQWGAGNTASLRGSILRIKPDNSQKGYSIPKGNFGEYWADQFENQGNTALAAEYRNPNKVLPELYTKGHRSNYSITVHPTKDWIAFGEVNPASADDEFHLVKNPLFAGYPYYYGNNKRTAGHTIPANNIVNNSTIHSGVKNLPPAVPGTINGLARVGITGPIYGYDSTLHSEIKFPPHFNHYWFNFDFSTQRMWSTKINDNGSIGANNEISAAGKLLDDAVIINPIDAHFGPDGALYIINYAGWFSSSANTGIVRIEYKGSCRPTITPVAETGLKGAFAELNSRNIKINHPSKYELKVFDLRGEVIHSLEAEGSMTFNIETLITSGSSGIYFLQIESNGLKETKQIIF